MKPSTRSSAASTIVFLSAWALAACAGAASGSPPVATAPQGTAPPTPSTAQATVSGVAPATMPSSAPRTPGRDPCGHGPVACSAAPPAYAREVLPILEKRCFGCHTGDGIAADEHDFSRIDALRGAHTALVDEVSTCAMPPRTRLADAEADTLLRWVACGQKTD